VLILVYFFPVKILDYTLIFEKAYREIESTVYIFLLRKPQNHRNVDSKRTLEVT